MRLYLIRNAPRVINWLSVIIVTRNEEKRIAHALKPLSTEFSDIRVIDSNSEDETARIAKGFGARVTGFTWNKAYPKKYGWCLENIVDAKDWVLFVDADEILTPELISELRDLKPEGAGYFIRSRYRIKGKLLKFGLTNNKLCLLNRHKMKFPTVNDLDIEGMGEIEGHYQPVRRNYFKKEKIGRLKNIMIHDAYSDEAAWLRKHERYAKWEAEMNRRNIWPRDPSLMRDMLKAVFRNMPLRPLSAFLHSYIFKLGILDGFRGFKLARSRYLYYRMINAAAALAANKDLA